MEPAVRWFQFASQTATNAVFELTNHAVGANPDTTAMMPHGAENKTMTTHKVQAQPKAEAERKGLHLTKNADGTLNIHNVQYNPNPRRSGENQDGKCYLAIKAAVKVAGLLADNPERECTINVTCYPPAEPGQAAASVLRLDALDTVTMD